MTFWSFGIFPKKSVKCSFPIRFSKYWDLFGGESFRKVKRPNPTFFGLFTFLMLSPTNRSQHFENRMGNEHFTDFFVKLSKLKKLIARY